MSVKKDDRIVVIAGEELKKQFKQACDGRTMSYVLIQFMKDYVDSKKVVDDDG